MKIIICVNFILLLVFISKQQCEGQDKLRAAFHAHKPLDVRDDHLHTIQTLSDIKLFKDILPNILKPRVVGTNGHKEVREYIVNNLKKLAWHVEVNKFEDQTPVGPKEFQNIIATVNPSAKRYLVLACHYDSKYFPNMEFLGATDSAVPCAMMIYLANILEEHLKSIQERDSLSLMYIFFDGEEAMKEWSATDSIYGARHLAHKWNNEQFLHKLDIIVLLDLLGAPDPQFYSFFKQTENWYFRLAFAEERLAAQGYLKNISGDTLSRPQSSNKFFKMLSTRSYIEDDHIPFLQLGVPILHCIPLPFPKEWHKVGDNHDLIDYNTVEDLCKIFKLFVLEYLRIPGDVQPSK